MSRRSGLVALALAAAFLSMVLLPVAAADHAYSHRYVIYGRLVDAEGAPLQGVTMDVRFEHFTYDNSCNPGQPGIDTEAFGPTVTKQITNEYGEFIFCLHTHGMSRFEPGTGVVRALDESGEELAQQSFELDGFRRVSFVTVQAEGETGGNAALLDDTYTVAGRLWRETGQQQLEGITVWGNTVDRENVTITLEYNDGQTATYQTRTNDYGDFSVRVPVEERPTSGTVTIEAAGETFTAPVDGDTGITTMTGTLQEVKDPVLGRILVVLGVIAAVIVVGAVGVLGYRKVSANREAAAARAQSTRKRAKR